MFKKEKFCEIIQHIELLQEQSERINLILQDLLYKSITNDFIDAYAFNNPIIEQDLIDALEEMYSDKNHWISYYVYELNCGTDWYKGKITDSQGNDIPLACAEDLWKLIQENVNDNL